MVHNPSDDEVILESLDLCRDFLDQLTEDTAQYEGLLIAINKDQQGDGQIDEMMRSLHSHKGTAGALAYHVIMNALHKLEEGLIVWQKEREKFNLDLMMDQLELIQKVADTARDSSLSHKEFLQRYEELRESMRSAKVSSQGFRVLLVDAAQASNAIVKEKLEGRGLSVTTCNDGYTALGKVLHEGFSAIMCGGLIHGLEGPALVAALKLNSATKDLHTILMSSNKRQSVVVQPDLFLERTEDSITKAAAWLEEKAKV